RSGERPEDSRRPQSPQRKPKMQTDVKPPVQPTDSERSYYLEISIDTCPLQAGGYMGDAPWHFILKIKSQAIMTPSLSDRGVVVAELTVDLLLARAMDSYREDPIITADADDQELYEAAEEVLRAR